MTYINQSDVESAGGGPCGPKHIWQITVSYAFHHIADINLPEADIKALKTLANFSKICYLRKFAALGTGLICLIGKSGSECYHEVFEAPRSHRLEGAINNWVCCRLPRDFTWVCDCQASNGKKSELITQQNQSIPTWTFTAYGNRVILHFPLSVRHWTGPKFFLWMQNSLLWRAGSGRWNFVTQSRKGIIHLGKKWQREMSAEI